MRADSALPSRKTQAVTFDLWETLLFDEREWDQRRKEIRSKRLLEALSRKGLSVPLQKIRDAYDQIVPWLTSFWNRNEEVPTIEQVKKIIEQIGMEVFPFQYGSKMSWTRRIPVPLMEIPFA